MDDGQISIRRDRVVAVGLLTARDLEVLGQGFTRLFPVDSDDVFSDLLIQLGQIERQQQSNTTSRVPLP